MTTSAVLDVRGATRSFHGHLALDDVTFQVAPGSVVGLVGPNGSGKSTLVSCIVGLDRPTHGRVTVDGRPAGSGDAKAAISFVPDELPLPELLTGREYIELVCDLEHRPTAPAVAIADIFALEGHLDKLLGSYSPGMKRRIQFSLALSSPAPLVVMDEPFSGLDVEAVVMLRAALRRCADQGRTCLVTIHDVPTAERECDRVLVMSNGHLVANGSPAEIRRSCGAATLEDAVLTLSDAAAGVGARVDSLLLAMESAA